MADKTLRVYRFDWKLELQLHPLPNFPVQYVHYARICKENIYLAYEEILLKVEDAERRILELEETYNREEGKEEGSVYFDGFHF